MPVTRRDRQGGGTRGYCMSGARKCQASPLHREAPGASVVSPIGRRLSAAVQHRQRPEKGFLYFMRFFQRKCPSLKSKAVWLFFDLYSKLTYLRAKFADLREKKFHSAFLFISGIQWMLKSGCRPPLNGGPKALSSTSSIFWICVFAGNSAFGAAPKLRGFRPLGRWQQPEGTARATGAARQKPGVASCP